jgi:hypothetical protein
MPGCFSLGCCESGVRSEARESVPQGSQHPPEAGTCLSSILQIGNGNTEAQRESVTHLED